MMSHHHPSLLLCCAVQGSVVYPGAGGLLVPSPATPFNSQNPPGFGSGSCPLFLNDSAAAMQVRRPDTHTLTMTHIERLTSTHTQRE